MKKKIKLFNDTHLHLNSQEFFKNFFTSHLHVLFCTIYIHTESL